MADLPGIIARTALNMKIQKTTCVYWLHHKDTRLMSGCPGINERVSPPLGEAELLTDQNSH